MVGHRNRQDESQHPNVMHGPNAGPHSTGPAQQPNRASPGARGGYATCEIQSSIRRKYGDQHRKRHERVVVRANQVHGSFDSVQLRCETVVPGFNCKINCYEGSQLASYVERVPNQILMGEHDNAVSSVPETGLAEECSGWDLRPVQMPTALSACRHSGL